MIRSECLFKKGHEVLIIYLEMHYKTLLSKKYEFPKLQA